MFLFWNFGILLLLKVYIDIFVIVGKFFCYIEYGLEVFLKDKKVILIYGSGGIYFVGLISLFIYGEFYLCIIL